ncbi:hypothetical protein EZS27_008303 [termite gut metagenome]|uniref:Uncharacterized protein n=1 Tax=termite gut metagenome TaxID=433724 RepID=A0A5J4SD77_9ZZZZ
MADLVTRILLDNKQFNDNIEKSKKQVDSFKNIQSNVIGTLGKFAGAIGIAGTAMATFDKLIKSSQTTSDAWDKTINAAKDSVNSFFTAIGTGDFSSFFQGLDSLIIKSNAATKALDQLGNSQMSFDYKNAQIDRKIAEARETATNKDLNKGERQIGLNAWSQSLNEKQSITNTLKNDILTSVQTELAKSNSLKANDISFEDIEKFVSLDISEDRDKIKSELEKQYKEYTIKAAKIAKDISNVNAGYREGGISRKDRDKDIAVYKEEANVLANLYKDSNLYNETLVKLSDVQLKGIKDRITQYQNLDKVIADSNKEYNQTEYKVKNSSDKTTKTNKTEEIISSGSIAELDKKLSDLRKQFLAVSDTELRAQLSSEISWVESQRIKLTFEAKFPFKESIQPQMAGLGNATKGTDISKIKLKPIITQQDVKLNNEYLDGLTAMGSVMGNLNNVFNNNTNSVLRWASTTISAVASIIPVIQTLTLAKKQEAVVAGIASAAETPLVGWLMVAGAAAAVLASFASIPQMAEGGLVYKNSLVNVAEYGNASSNPEVIAPLNKLKSLLHNDNDTSNNGGEVKFRIDGTTLIGVLNNYNKKTSKVR